MQLLSTVTRWGEIGITGLDGCGRRIRYGTEGLHKIMWHDVWKQGTSRHDQEEE